MFFRTLSRALFFFVLFFTIFCPGLKGYDGKAARLYWFIPDGMRADPELFTVFEWARRGDLPNIKKLMENGAYGYCIPVFPSHTPVNFASLFTGSTPKVHGVADGPMHVEGLPLDRVSIGGFSSVAKKVPPIWMNMEQAGKKVFLLSLPGSTPPELEEGVTVRGRWGGWGADFHAINFQSTGDLEVRKKQGRGARLFFFGPELTKYVDLTRPTGWHINKTSYSDPLEAVLPGWGCRIYAYIYDTSDDQKVNYDRIIFSVDKKSILADISKTGWSNWCPVRLNWQDREVDSSVRIRVIRLKLDGLSDDGFFRIRCFYNNLNRYAAKPPDIADEIISGVGPMVDFVDNYPPQLIYYPEDKQVFLEEMRMSLNWHRSAAAFVLDRYAPDVYIQDTYSPNQMLTSRWWLGYLDPSSKRYKDIQEQERGALWEEVMDMYRELDAIIGEYMNRAGPDTLVILSSDHGAAPLNSWVRLNNLFAREGLLKFEIDDKTGEPVIDWASSKVIFLKMDNVYIKPDGLAGDWKRGSGTEYEALRNRVIKLLSGLKDKDGKKPAAAIVKWEKVEDYWDLPADRVGDLIVSNRAGYGWNEEVTRDLEVFSAPLKSGYKQAILPEDTRAMWTPFVVMGPGVKKGYRLKKPIRITDQYPTIMYLMGLPIPDFVEGRIVDEICE